MARKPPHNPELNWALYIVAVLGSKGKCPIGESGNWVCLEANREEPAPIK
jgi:hypothetical protein